MSIRKFNCVRVYSFGNSYVLSSDNVKDEKLQIRLSNSTVCVNSLSTEEWNSLSDSRTNSVTSSTFANVFTGYGFLGLLSTSIDLNQTMQAFQQPQFQQQQVVNNKKDDSATMQHFLLFVKDASSVGTVKSFEVMRITEVFVLPLHDESNQFNYQLQLGYTDFINDIKKLLSSGTFYFSLSSDPNLTFDLTLSSQARNSSYKTNKKFLWNYNMHIPLRRLNIDTNLWLLKIICGYVEIKKILIQAKSYRVGIISRLSCERVGARFHCRGINDYGNCANFVETEQVIYSTETDEEVSFLQLRGSAPVFFEQTGLQVGSHKIKISRSIQACYPAFERHVQSLLQEYGPKIYVLNLLGTKGDEESLTDFYKDLCQFSHFSMKEQLMYTHFDYHTEMKLSKLSLDSKLWFKLINKFYENNLTDGAFYYNKSRQANDNDSGFNSEANSSYSTIKEQTKFIRTNCMDCLDRTDSVQSYIGKQILPLQLRGLVDSENDIRKFVEVFNQMWISNGDNISRIYTGTGSIQGLSVTKDLTTSLSRAFQNNFLDDNKHDSIESFLFSMSRNYGHLNDRVSVLMSKSFLRLPYQVLKEIVSLKNDYAEREKCKVLMATWNINGGLSYYDMNQLNLNDWLIDGPLNAKKTGLGYLDSNLDISNLGEIDIFCIGFEEIVDLSAQNIVKASEENASIWRQKINEYLKKYGDYVELINENLQLVGVCIFVFVLKKHVGAIRDVCVAKAKTGFGGTAGNKGGVLLRFIYYNTSMCFVCSHFAAHQKEIKQRNDDFRQIYEQSVFSGQKSNSQSKINTKNHDYIFWCGDLNYRIDLQNDYCRSLIKDKNWNTLLEADQLSVQRKEQAVFKEFNEAPISFPPTYKYNVGEDSYDRSEKCRVPAWTDRILWRRRIYPKEREIDIGKCLYYGRADIRYSDHRPVSSLIEVEICKVIPKKLIETLNKVFMSCHGSFQVVLIVTTHINRIDENVKNELLKLFMSVPTFAAVRQYKNNLYITYSDAKFAYEAFAQFNNYYLEVYDLNVQIKVENEQNYLKVIEEELMDCLSSLDYFKNNNNIRKMSANVNENKIIDLLSNEKENSESSFMSYINVPSQLHSNVSITNNMHNFKASDLESVSSNNDLRHEYHNPLTKALSNSNLNSLQNLNNHHQHYNQTRFIHSEANLLDLSNDETGFMGHNLSLNVPQLPPQRPPPPPPNKLPAHQEQPLIEILDENNIGFEDDFSSFETNQISSNSSSSSYTKPTVPPRPPPIPPLPNQSNNENGKPKPVFSLFDDSFEPIVPVQAQQMKTQPPLPPYPNRTLNSNNSLPQQAVFNNIQVAVPPPLPPLPTINKQLPQTFAINPNNATTNTNNKTTPPPLPPPPKVPPRIPSQQKTQATSQNSNPSNLNILIENLTIQANNNNNNNNQNQENKINNFDPFGDSFVNYDPSALPPPRMSHFS